MTHENSSPNTAPWGLSWKRFGALGAAVLATVFILLSIPALVEVQSANEVMIIQSAGGELQCFTEPGPHMQLYGQVTKYPRRNTYAFKHDDTEGGKPSVDEGKQLQFNDGGKAKLYAAVNWEMPLDCKQIIAVHRAFGSTAGVQENGVAQMVNTAVYLSGPTMSSTESSAERRGELVSLINDQAQRGTYQTTAHQVERPDPVTGERKMQMVVEIQRNPDGTPKRQQGSILENFGIKLQPIAITRIKYSDEVERQIAERQKATQQVQLAQANARRAEQDAITAAKQGEATAMKMKWEQEAIKAKLVTEAQQKLEVATLSAKSAEQYKREQILRGEGDSERRKLALAADGALDAKLEVYKQVQAIWAQNFGAFKGALVPQIQMGGTAGPGNALSSAQAIMELVGTKAAKDLALDLSNVSGAKAPGR